MRIPCVVAVRVQRSHGVEVGGCVSEVPGPPCGFLSMEGDRADEWCACFVERRVEDKHEGVLWKHVQFGRP